MQNTRFNNLVDIFLDQFGEGFRNPWRRFSLLVIALLFGFFLGTAIPTAAGQRSLLDLVGAGILVLFTEVINALVYRVKQRGIRSLVTDTSNALRLGLTYSLFVEAFKLGS
ncbi:MAG: DUF565 domain-containing protein [Leptolyngbyaceae bacterium]|nr:DUF565 domain-containing protein [Leptolyngbyaceae bacterium]